MYDDVEYDKPEDFVIATGVQHSVREFATLAFHHAGIELEWQGEKKKYKMMRNNIKTVIDK